MSHKEPNAYAIPLDDKQLIMLGTVTVVWGQIDLLASYCIARLLGVNPVSAAVLMDKMTGGPRIGLLEKLAKKAKTASLTKKILNFCKVMSGLNERRNSVFHAYWSFHIDGKTKTHSVGAVSAKNPSTIFTIDQLRKMLDKLHAQSYMIDEIFRELHGIKFDRSRAGFHLLDNGSIRAIKLVPKHEKRLLRNRTRPSKGQR